MRIPQNIGPYPIDYVRTLMRRLRFFHAFSNEDVETIFAKDRLFEVNWLRLRRELVIHGLIARITSGYDRGQYKVTQRGIALAASNAYPRMTRKAIDKLFAESLQRVKEVNSDDRFVYRFSVLGVFGSFLRDEPDYGDLDLFYQLVRKPPWSEREDWLRPAEDYHLLYFPGDVDTFGARMTTRALKYVRNRNGRITLHHSDQLLYLGLHVPHRIVFGEFTDEFPHRPIR